MVSKQKTSGKTAAFQINDCGWVKCINEFIASLMGVRKNIDNRKLWFRGHSSTSYELLPTIGREKAYSNGKGIFSEDQERELLHRFRRRVYPHSERVLKAGEAMFLARHHGLPTRLLDWTANALYGLYFACASRPDKSAALWAIQRFPVVEDLDAFELARIEKEDDLLNMYVGGVKGISRGKLTEDAVKLVHPFYNSPRILAQDGAFTFHSNPWQPLEAYNNVSFKYEKLDICALYRWRVRSQHKRRFIEELSGLGITHRMVFPDLDGIAKSLWETEALWNFARKKI